MKQNIWEFVRKDDGTFEILHSGKILKTSIPNRWLEEEIGKYGFCGQEYHEIRIQLDRNGKARIVF